MLYGKFDPLPIGKHITQRFEQGVTRAMAARAAKGRPEQFFDVPFQELVQDPIAMVHRIHQHFELPIPEDMDSAMDNWLNNGRADKRGQHQYRAERYGLNIEAIHDQYAEYIERYSIAVKKP